MIVVEGVETVDCEGLNTVIPGKTKLPLSHQVYIMVAIIIIIVIIVIIIVIFIVIIVSVAGNIIPRQHHHYHRPGASINFTFWQQMCRK